MKNEEHVLVVERRLLDELGSFQGLQFDTDGYIAQLLNPENYSFVARSLAEDDPSLKQLIPYFIIRHDSSIWCYVRGKASGEERLVSKMSIGIGGHINNEDLDLFENIYSRGADRELHEEVNVPEGSRNRIVALLNDDSNDVGKVHLGVVHVLDCPSAEVSRRENVIADAGFRTVEELGTMRDRLETWSQICFDQLEALTA